MTLSTTLAVKRYDGDGSTTAFPTTFKFEQNSHIQVVHRDAGGTETGWVENTHYTLSGAGSDGGGTVSVLNNATDYTPASGETLVISRSVPEIQETDYPEGGAFPAFAHEQALDLLTMMLQQHSGELSRALLIPVSDPASSIGALPNAIARASKYLAFDGSGAPMASDGAVSGVPVSSFMATVLDDATAAAARTTLGLGGVAVEDVAAGGSGDLLRADGDGSSLTGIATGATNQEIGNILLNAFRISVNGGLSVQSMIDGVVDEFEDETGVDVATSTDEIYDATGDFYANGGGYTGDKIPTMASATAPSGTASHSSSYGGQDAWLAMNDDYADNGWLSADLTKPQWIEYQFTTSRVIKKYTLRCRLGDLGRMVRDWELQAYNGTSWDVLDTQTAQTGWAASELREFTIANSTAYTRYRIHITADNGGNVGCSIAELEMMEDAPTTNMVLVSNAAANAPASAPGDALAVMWHEAVDAVTMNTDCVVEVSRDNGATFTAVTMIEEAVISGNQKIFVGSVDISAQPSGTSMKWRLTVANNKHQKLHAIALEWS